MRRTSILMALLSVSAMANAQDWLRFRGENGAGASTGASVATVWDDKTNLKWKTALPGPGASSPIVVGGKVFVTCYTGYGTDTPQGADMASLKRHLLCIDRKDGKVLWTRSVTSTAQEDSYRGYIQEHGYASSTPVSDGERVYVFYGKSGVFAYDLEGKDLWKANVGVQSSNRQWGSGASLITYKNLVIVNAGDESRSLRAYDGKTGKEVWKVEAAKLELAYSTPSLVDLPDGKKELVVGVPGELWAFEPETGKNTWYVGTNLEGNLCPSVVTNGDVVFACGGFQRVGSIAVKAGGKGDVTQSNVLWFSRATSYVPTPIYHKGHLYWLNEQGSFFCVDAKTGAEVFQERLKTADGSRPRAYASLVLVGDKFIAVTRNHGAFVLAASTKFEQLGQNRFVMDGSVFNGTPAVSNGQIFLRSNAAIYCIESQK